jgi:hypothetical protein
MMGGFSLMMQESGISNVVHVSCDRSGAHVVVPFCEECRRLEPSERGRERGKREGNRTSELN